MEKIGKYRILERIGRGGMGMVFKAHDPVLDRIVALKVISSDVDVTEELRARFFREAQATARLSHPNIVTVYDMGEDDGRLFIVMEFLEGVELRRIIGERQALSIAEKLSLMIQVCDGLDYAHEKGIVHRDIKPGNVFVVGTGQVKLLDFGIAHMAAATDGLTRTGLIMGTLRYMSPEQMRGRVVDRRSDIFSLACVFYELLAYCPAFAGEDPIQLLEAIRSQNPRSLTEIDPTIPLDLSRLIETALEKDPARRFQTSHEMREQLEHVRQVLGRATEPVAEESFPAASAPQGKISPSIGAPQESTVIVPPATPPGGPRRPVDAPAPCAPTPQQRAMTLVQAAQDHLDRGNVEAAAEQIKEALDLVPDLPEADAVKERIRASATQRYRQKRAAAAPTTTNTPRESSRYQELKQLGDGPSGCVYLAWDRHLARPAALKVVPPGSTLDREHFERAAYAWQALPEHPNVVHVYDVASHEGSPCIVMEYLPGKMLDKLIAERPYMALMEKVSLVAQLCDGVSFLHSKDLIHRDIRPSSILVMSDGQLKLLESGIARSALPQDPEVTRTFRLIEDYRAPEQARGRPEQRSDIFGVGAVLFELLTFRRLPTAASESEIVQRLESTHPPIPKDMIAVAARALKSNPAERFATVHEMRRELARYLHRSPRVLFAVHGIRTHWAWQRALTEVAEANHWRCRMDDWSFGYFSVIRFLLPWQRKTKIEWFRRTYETEVRSRDVELPDGKYPSIVAHSFGTYILGNALLAYANIRFDKVILCGSILPCDFPWDALIDRGQVQAVRNEYGVRDMWTRVVNWFVRGTGPSGRSPFARDHERLEQEEFFYDHSEYFEKGHMRQKWFAFLERQWPEISESATRIARPKTSVPVALYLAYGAVLLSLGWMSLTLFGR